MGHTLRVTITRTRRRTLTTNAGGAKAHCVACGHAVGTVSKQQAMELLCVGEGAFDELSDAGLVHVVRTVAGSVAVCEDSLFTE